MHRGRMPFPLSPRYALGTEGHPSNSPTGNPSSLYLPNPQPSFLARPATPRDFVRTAGEGLPHKSERDVQVWAVPRAYTYLGNH